MDVLGQKQILSRFIDDGEKDKAIKQLIEWSNEIGFKKVINEVLEPQLEELGQRWMKGELSLAHGYVSGKIAEEFYLIASENKEFMEASRQNKGTVVLGNIEDDFHPLGRKLVSIFAKSAGWNIIDLGNDVMAETFVEEAIKANAHIIAISAMMFTTAKNIIKVREELIKQQPNTKIKIAVGGAIFKLRPELVSKFNADGTADNAIDAPALFDSLIQS